MPCKLHTCLAIISSFFLTFGDVVSKEDIVELCQHQRIDDQGLSFKRSLLRNILDNESENPGSLEELRPFLASPDLCKQFDSQSIRRARSSFLDKSVFDVPIAFEFIKDFMLDFGLRHAVIIQDRQEASTIYIAAFKFFSAWNLLLQLDWRNQIVVSNQTSGPPTVFVIMQKAQMSNGSHHHFGENVWLLNSPDPASDLKDIHCSLHSNVFTFSFAGDDSVKVQEVYRVQPSMSLIVNQIGFWNGNSGLTVPLQHKWDRRTNLGGINLVVATIHVKKILSHLHKHF